MKIIIAFFGKKSRITVIGGFSSVFKDIFLKAKSLKTFYLINIVNVPSTRYSGGPVGIKSCIVFHVHELV
jgi:hypothetical protein